MVLKLPQKCLKGLNMAREKINSLYKNFINSLEQRLVNNKTKLFALALTGCLQAT